MDLFVDGVRLLNAVLASIVFCALVYKGRIFYKNYDLHQKMLYLSFTLYAFTAAYGSVEAYSQDAPFGYRIVMLLVANTVAVYAFVRFRNSAFGDRSHIRR